MALAPFYDMEARQGDTFLRTLQYLDDTESPIDLTGVSVEFSLAPSRGGRPTFTYSEEDDISVDGPQGRVFIEVPSEETKGWNLPRLFYEVTLTFADGRVLTILEGRLVVRQEVVD